MVKLVKTEEVMIDDLGRLFLQFAAKIGVRETQRQWNAFKRREGAVWQAVKKEAGHNRKIRERVWKATGVAI